jgi:hypothetical protein
MAMCPANAVLCVLPPRPFGLLKISRLTGCVPDMLGVHDQFIIDNVPKEKLLLMRLEEGWEPLCKFLGKPIPKVPFPHANDSASADQVAAYMLGMCLVRWLVLLGTTAAGSYAAYRYATGSLDVGGLWNSWK